MYKYWLLLPLLCILLIELGLRWLWLNPYSLYAEPHSESRLHEPGLVAYVNVDNDTYPGTHSIRFAINSTKAVSSGPAANPGEIIALGGSTTECGLIPEGQRWPDLLDPPAHNFGVSGNTSLDSYQNLKYLLAKGAPKFKTILLMHGVNDLDRFLSRGLEDFNRWEPRPIANVLAMLDSADQQIFSFLRVKDSALLSFIRYYSNNLKGRPFYTPLAKQAAAQAGQAPLSDSGFAGLTQRLRKELLPAREKIYRQLAELCDRAGLDLVLLTQPHAFAADYRPPGPDLRVFPSYHGKLLNTAQTSFVMDLINNQTRSLAAQLDLRLLDADACFTAGNTDLWFFDSVHYTPEGAKQFATCINQGWN